LKYVDATASGSPFEGRQLCASDDVSFHPIMVAVEYSFHPNDTGHEEYYALIKPFID
jgi:hypothetical protein